jgi:hypothetical protein
MTQARARLRAPALNRRVTATGERKEKVMTSSTDREASELYLRAARRWSAAYAAAIADTVSSAAP